MPAAILEVRDLSPSGLFLDTTFARGTALHLEFELETGAAEVVGEVRRVVDLEGGLNEVASSSCASRRRRSRPSRRRGKRNLATVTCFETEGLLRYRPFAGGD
ncbi:MAG: hypothetical protein AMXMBFR34_29200 [Myxococcaceae bacterium]